MLDFLSLQTASANPTFITVLYSVALSFILSSSIAFTYEKTYRVRYRIDGILEEVASPPNNLAVRLSARLKVMSRLDISEKRVPQDGRIKLKYLKISP